MKERSNFGWGVKRQFITFVLLATALCSLAKRDPAVADDRIMGEAIFRQKCTGCHSLGGEGGKYAPDLAQIGALRDRKYLENKLKNPRKTNSSSIMPSFTYLSEHELKALVTFLQSLR